MGTDQGQPELHQGTSVRTRVPPFSPVGRAGPATAGPQTQVPRTTLQEPRMVHPGPLHRPSELRYSQPGLAPGPWGGQHPPIQERATCTTPLPRDPAKHYSCVHSYAPPRRCVSLAKHSITNCHHFPGLLPAPTPGPLSPGEHPALLLVARFPPGAARRDSPKKLPCT